MLSNRLAASVQPGAVRPRPLVALVAGIHCTLSNSTSQKYHAALPPLGASNPKPSMAARARRCLTSLLSPVSCGGASGKARIYIFRLMGCGGGARSCHYLLCSAHSSSAWPFQPCHVDFSGLIISHSLFGTDTKSSAANMESKQ